MIDKSEYLPCPLHFIACKSVLIFMMFYSAKVSRGMVTFGRSMVTKGLADEAI